MKKDKKQFVLDIAGLKVTVSGEAFVERDYIADQRFLKRHAVNATIVRFGAFTKPAKRTIVHRNEHALYGKLKGRFYIALRNKWAIGYFDKEGRRLEIVVQKRKEHKVGACFVFVLFLPFLLSKYDGFLLHACGIYFNHRGLIFTGRSGRGKSTLARLLESGNGNVVINDDILVIRAINGRFIMANIPGWRQLYSSEPKQFRVDHLFFVRHAKRNTIEPVEVEASLYGFYSGQKWYHSMFADFKNKKEGTELLLSFVHQVTCNRLGFLPTRALQKKLNNFIRAH